MHLKHTFILYTFITFAFSCIYLNMRSVATTLQSKDGSNPSYKKLMDEVSVLKKIVFMKILFLWRFEAVPAH